MFVSTALFPQSPSLSNLFKRHDIWLQIFPSSSSIMKSVFVTPSSWAARPVQLKKTNLVTSYLASDRKVIFLLFYLLIFHWSFFLRCSGIHLSITQISFEKECNRILSYPSIVIVLHSLIKFPEMWSGAMVALSMWNAVFCVLFFFHCTQ